MIRTPPAGIVVAILYRLGNGWNGEIGNEGGTDERKESERLVRVWA